MYLEANEENRYAFEWEESEEGMLRGFVWDYLSLAMKDAGETRERYGR